MDVPRVDAGESFALLARDLELDLEDFLLPPPPPMEGPGPLGAPQLRLDCDWRDLWERREAEERTEGDKLLLEDMVSATRELKLPRFWSGMHGGSDERRTISTVN